NKTDNDEAAEIATKMMKEVDRFVNMTQEVLDFSRGVSDLKLDTVQLSELLPTVVAFIDQDLSKRDIKIKKEFRYTGKARLDSDKTMRVFHNIAGNAADAMPEGGTFTIRIDKKDDRLVFEFADTGIGMTEEVRLRAFEPFFTRGKRHGTGLGLAIVKKIIDDHNGTVEIESEVKRGTTIRLTLPAP
ncbi:MAG: HAMP domain-containing histidine kinase, partial [Ignavibacteriae bacterium]|nr:HAMP domain-containing histidine kinase [Ignavibacteriota bacterium]